MLAVDAEQRPVRQRTIGCSTSELPSMTYAGCLRTRGANSEREEDRCDDRLRATLTATRQSQSELGRLQSAKAPPWGRQIASRRSALVRLQTLHFSTRSSTRQHQLTNHRVTYSLKTTYRSFSSRVEHDTEPILPSTLLWPPRAVRRQYAGQV